MHKYREALKKVYNYPAWAEKVDALCPDQVLALYIRLCSGSDRCTSKP